MAYDEGLRSITIPADASIGFYTGPAGMPGSPSPLSTPTGVGITNGGTAGTTHYSYRVSANSASGETLASVEATTVTGNAALTGTNFNTITWAAVPNAVSYNVYGRTIAAEQKLRTVTALTYNDTGVDTPAGALPTVNLSGSNAGKQFRFVKVTGLQAVGLAIGAANEIVEGVLQNKPQTVGAAATVGIRGVSIVMAGATFAGGEAVKVNTDGTAIVAAPGSAFVGVALTAGAAGDLISVRLHI